MSRKRALVGFALAAFAEISAIVILLLGLQIIPNDLAFREHRLFWITPALFVLAIFLFFIGVQGLQRSLTIQTDGRAVFRKSSSNSETFRLLGDDMDSEVVARQISRTQTNRPAFNVFHVREGGKDRKLLNAVVLTEDEIRQLARSGVVKFEGLNWANGATDMRKQKHQGRPRNGQWPN